MDGDVLVAVGVHAVVDPPDLVNHVLLHQAAADQDEVGELALAQGALCPSAELVEQISCDGLVGDVRARLACDEGALDRLHEGRGGHHSGEDPRDAHDPAPIRHRRGVPEANGGEGDDGHVEGGREILLDPDLARVRLGAALDGRPAVGAAAGLVPGVEEGPEQHVGEEEQGRLGEAPVSFHLLGDLGVDDVLLQLHKMARCAAQVLRHVRGLRDVVHLLHLRCDDVGLEVPHLLHVLVQEEGDEHEQPQNVEGHPEMHAVGAERDVAIPHRRNHLRDDPARLEDPAVFDEAHLHDAGDHGQQRRDSEDVGGHGGPGPPDQLALLRHGALRLRVRRRLGNRSHHATAG
mmetsp:Transcript_109047/g.305198  ORF Transcript_109047/g.305198 Transcript_109047/m.305198 type:complete len:348 (-) Transcript_109047:48-1091(-)